MILTLLLFVGMVLEVFGLRDFNTCISILLDPEMIETNLDISLREVFSRIF